MKPRTVSRVLLLLSVLASMGIGHPASATPVGPPYEDAFAYCSARTSIARLADGCPAAEPTGHATADGTANVATGLLSVSTSATGALPVGSPLFDFLGSSTVQLRTTVTTSAAGILGATINAISGSTSAVCGGCALTLVQAAHADVVAWVIISYLDADGGAHFGAAACFLSIDGSPTPGSVTIPDETACPGGVNDGMTVPATTEVDVTVQLDSSSYVSGPGVASAAVSGTVSAINVP